MSRMRIPPAPWDGAAQARSGHEDGGTDVIGADRVWCRALGRLIAVVAVLFVSSSSATGQTADLAVEYYHVDAVGSVRAVTDQSGTVVRRHDYFPFGDGPVEVSAATDPMRFTGKERDIETGLDYFGARYYASRAGRFTTVDPGHVGGNIFDPQSWNAYAYARNNPLRFVDPTGTDYRVNIFGGDTFWVETDRDLQGLEQGGFSFRGGNIFNAAGTWVGTYDYFDRFARLAFDVSRTAGPGVNFAVGLGAAQVGILAGGAAVAAASGTTLTTLAIGSAPLLPAVPTAVDKLQRIGLSVQQAAEIVANPGSQRLVDRANGNTINVIKQVGDKLVRITLDPSGQRIISAGYIQGRNIANSIASGRFIPQ